MFDYEKYAPEYQWWSATYDDAKAAAATMGIDIADIAFSGFWSQGDGASFTGSYAYQKGAAAAIREYAPKDTELHRIADELQRVQRVNFYRLRADISKSRHRYQHEYTMAVEVDRTDGVDADLHDAHDTVTEAMRDLARWIYKQLEREYEYQSAWQMARGWQDLASDVAAEKAAARQLIRDMRQARRADVPASICAALRATVRRHLQAAADALTERDAIASEFGYWEDGRRVDVAEFAAVNL